MENPFDDKNTEQPRSPIRRLVSKRDISIQAFELENGHLMLESSLLDPYHLIRLHIRIRPDNKEIISAHSEFASHPHANCPMVAVKAASLVGLRIERGITKAVLRLIGSSEGCVHLRELALETINFAATTLIGYDEGFGLMSREFNILNEDQKYALSRRLLANTCFIYKTPQPE